MAESITPRSKDFPQWYQDVVLKARMADYSPVKGCMVIRPNGYGIWEKMKQELDDRFKKTGHKNAYFPLFIPEGFLKKEAEHVEGFAPECAVVTSAGGKDLEEKLVVRPTSETIINSMFSKWIQSYRDLPMLLNQWANVVRWEMRTRLFLRTTEFLWQEGHTCHETEKEAEDETLKMLRVYKDFAENCMAMPVIAGLKTDAEKFAGAVRTYCIEAMMQDKKALQAGTSHNLGQNFAKAFDTNFLAKDGKRQLVHQTSWGVSTRLVGGLIMTHSDDKGLVIPPKLAPVHVVVMPIAKGKPQDAELFEIAERLQKEISAGSSELDYRPTVDVDRDDKHSVGWKFHEYELIGVPVRVELGYRDLEKKQVTIARRDTGKKEFVPIEKAAGVALSALKNMQTELFEKAKKNLRDNSFVVGSFDEFKKKLPDGFLHAHWCENPKCEAEIQKETKATIRCIPLDKEDFIEPDKAGKCVKCGSDGKGRVIFARSY